MTGGINEYQPQSVSHPGRTLAEKLRELDMGSKEFSIRVDKPEKTITAVTKGNSSITPEMAVKFEDVLKIPAAFWLSRQRRYDEYLARLKRQKDINAAFEWAKKFPYAKMADLGWVSPTRKNEEKVIALFGFFAVSNHKAWEAYYYNQALKVNFRISLAQTSESFAVSAWLRKGELQAQELDSPAYSASAFKKSLSKIKAIMTQSPENYFEGLQNICKKAGVRVVHTPCLPKVPVHGSTRWLGSKPLIQLSDKYENNEKFWFTFFHEAGHILLHGKKYISIENITYDEMDMLKEQEADYFAAKHIG